MKLDDADWDALLELAQRWGEAGRTEVVRRMIREAVSREPTEMPVRIPPMPMNPPPVVATAPVVDIPTHVHDWTRETGASGNFIWVCKCGERRLTKPIV